MSQQISDEEKLQKIEVLMFENFEDCQKHLENLTPKKLKKEFLKGEIKESKFLLSKRF
jgi:hypothetical protein